MNGPDALHHRLSPDDERLLDALVEVGFETEALEGITPAARRRAEALVKLIGLMDDYPVEDADETLIHATMANIDRCEAQRAARMTLDPQEQQAVRARRLVPLRVPNFVSVAAVILIGASIVWPILSNLQKENAALRSQSNLAYVSRAMDSYADAHDRRVPIAKAGLYNTVTDTLNLTPLLEENYCRLKAPDGSVVQAPPGLFSRSNLVLLLDGRNPIVEAIREGRLDTPLRINLTQGGMQPEMLTPDGAILWLRQPIPRPDATRWRSGGVQWLKDDIRPENGVY
ncbi:MAG: hypothetical protein JSV91_13240 [Phycisphaerales bacterium]|nr:MAG: hypothetical protein JSV91_13240 [Phycisphaerales bacterium]